MVTRTHTRAGRVKLAAVLLGMGLGGLLEGIVLAQIAQWHQLLSAALPPLTLEAMRTNMAADGWFQLASWLLALWGVLMLWSSFRVGGAIPSSRTFSGYLLIGLGSFAVIEGTVNHHLLQLHHMRDLPQLVSAYDWLFLFGGLVLVLLGAALTDRKSWMFSLERRSGRDRRLPAPS